jgi:hypothetical protein
VRSNFLVELFSERLLVKVNLKILNSRQPVAWRDEQIVHKLINSTSCELDRFVLNICDRTNAEKQESTLLEPAAVERIDLQTGSG